MTWRLARGTLPPAPPQSSDGRIAAFRRLRPAAAAGGGIRPYWICRFEHRLRRHLVRTGGNFVGKVIYRRCCAGSESVPELMRETNQFRRISQFNYSWQMNWRKVVAPCTRLSSRGKIRWGFYGRWRRRRRNFWPVVSEAAVPWGKLLWLGW